MTMTAYDKLLTEAQKRQANDPQHRSLSEHCDLLVREQTAVKSCEPTSVEAQAYNEQHRTPEQASSKAVEALAVVQDALALCVREYCESRNLNFNNPGDYAKAVSELQADKGEDGQLFRDLYIGATAIQNRASVEEDD